MPIQPQIVRNKVKLLGRVFLGVSGLFALLACGGFVPSEEERSCRITARGMYAETQPIRDKWDEIEKQMDAISEGASSQRWRDLLDQKTALLSKDYLYKKVAIESMIERVNVLRSQRETGIVWMFATAAAWAIFWVPAFLYLFITKPIDAPH